MQVKSGFAIKHDTYTCWDAQEHTCSSKLLIKAMLWNVRKVLFLHDITQTTCRVFVYRKIFSKFIGIYLWVILIVLQPIFSGHSVDLFLIEGSCDGISPHSLHQSLISIHHARWSSFLPMQTFHLIGCYNLCNQHWETKSKLISI